MKSIKKLIFFAWSIFFIASISNAQDSKIYNPYLSANPEPLNFSGGYCKNADDERKLWAEINKFAKSFLEVVPQIPPEQKTYINAERNSKNTERLIGILNNSFYKMNDLYEEVENIEQLSTTYLKYQKQLVLAKKMEIIGRTLMNLRDENIPYDAMGPVAEDLKRKGYNISLEKLRAHWFIKHSLSKSLNFHLICYGENLK